MEYTNIGTFLGHFIIFIKRLSGEINETANYFAIFCGKRRNNCRCFNRVL